MSIPMTNEKVILFSMGTLNRMWYPYTDAADTRGALIGILMSPRICACSDKEVA